MSLSFSQRLGLRFGVEELAAGAVEEGLEENGRFLLEADSVENSYSTVDKINGDIMRLEKTSDSLENILIALESISSPSIDGPLYKLYTVSLENAALSADVQSDATSDKTTSESTEKSKKGVMAMLQAVWKALKDFYFKLLDGIQSFISRIFNSAGSMKEKVEKLISKLDGAKGDKVDKSKMKKKYSGLSLDGKIATPGEIEQNVSKMHTLAEHILNGVTSISQPGFLKGLHKVYEDLPEEKTIGFIKGKFISEQSLDNIKVYISSHVDKMADYGDLKEKTPVKEVTQVVGSDFDISHTSELLGGKYIYLGKPKKATNSDYKISNWIRDIKVGVVNVDSTPKESDFDVMEKTQLKNTLELMLKSLKYIILYKDKWFKSLRSKKDFLIGLTEVQIKLNKDKVRNYMIFVDEVDKKRFEALDESGQKAELAAFDKRFQNTLAELMRALVSFIGKQDSFEAGVCKTVMRGMAETISYASDCIDSYV